MARAWRIVKAQRAERAFDGEGARLHGGRWNSKGVAVIYTSESASLAMLEILVNVGSSTLLPAYAVAAAEIDEALVERLPEDELPEGWRSSPPPPALQALGDGWVRSGRSAVLALPSAVVPWETNFLLNPEHASFGEIVIEAPRRFAVDARLLRG
jgi:RES domain-containing protein